MGALAARMLISISWSTNCVCHVQAFTLSVRLLVPEYVSAWAHWQQRHGLQGTKLGTASQEAKGEQ